MPDLPGPRVIAVVLAYLPDESLVANVDALLSEVEAVLIVNNSTGSPSDGVIAIAAGLPRVSVLSQASNVGVAAGFNAGMRAGLAAGADFVWIFDQDSTVTPGSCDLLVQAHRAAGEDVGIIGPALRSHATGVVYRRESGSGVGEVDVLISSGSMFSRELLENIGLHDEPLFIDYVDHDISLRARRAGYHNLKVFGALLEHRFGESDPVRLFGRPVFLSHYSTLRQYYMARNRTIMIRRYGLGGWFWEDVVFTTKAWVKVLLLERNRPAKVRAFLRGCRDGWTYSLR